jgi:DNA-binding MarR family transcriptional regulator
VADPIDEIVAGWARERPDLPTRAVPVTSLVWRLARDLRARRDHALRQAGIDQATLDLLANLRRLGRPYEAAPGELAQKCGVTPAAISLRIRRAQESGWVERVTAATDGRRAVVRLTDRGAAAADEYAGRILRHDERLVAGWSERDLAELERLLRLLGASVSHDGG